MKKLLKILILSSVALLPATAQGEGPIGCPDLIGACNHVVAAQRDEIQGLKRALEESRGQTKKAEDVQKPDSGHSALIIGIIGVAAGAFLGAALAK